MIKMAGPLSGKTGMAAKVAHVMCAIFFKRHYGWNLLLYYCSDMTFFIVEQKFQDMEGPYGLHMSTKFQICSCQIREVILVLYAATQIKGHYRILSLTDKVVCERP